MIKIKEMLVKHRDSLLVLTVILQPLLENYYLNNGSIQILGVTFATFIRLIMVFILGLTVILDKELLRKSKKEFIFVILYIVYSVSHDFFVRNIKVRSTVSYNSISEAFYLIQMLIPLFYVYLAYRSRKINMRNITIWLTILLAGQIILLNFTGLALGSYTNEPIRENFFQWFIDVDANEYRYMASKGMLFHSMFSILVFMTSLLNAYYFIKENRKLHLSLFMISEFALILIGTKVQTYGALLILVGFIFMYLYSCFITKEFEFSFKKVTPIIVTAGALLLLLPFSPVESRKRKIEDRLSPKVVQAEKDTKPKQTPKPIVIEDEVKSEVEVKSYINYKLDINQYLNLALHEQPNKDDDIDQLINQFTLEKVQLLIINYFDENKGTLSISNRLLTEAYHYSIDPLFWYEIVNGSTLSQRQDNRDIEVKILNRLKSDNNNTINNLYGVSYSVASRMTYIEADFIYQFYTMGFFGVALILGPHILILMFSAFMFFKNYKTFKLEDMVLTFGILLIYLCTVYAGNFVDNLGAMMIMGFYEGFLLLRLKEYHNE